MRPRGMVVQSVAVEGVDAGVHEVEEVLKGRGGDVGWEGKRGWRDDEGGDGDAAAAVVVAIAVAATAGGSFGFEGGCAMFLHEREWYVPGSPRVFHGSGGDGDCVAA